MISVSVLGNFFSRPTNFHALRLNREVNLTSFIEIELFLDRLVVRLETKTSLCLDQSFTPNFGKSHSVTGMWARAYIGRIIQQMLSFFGYKLYQRCFSVIYSFLMRPCSQSKIIKDTNELLNSKQIQLAGARLKGKTKTLISIILSLKSGTLLLRFD